MKNSIEKFLEFNGRKVFFLNADGQWWIAIKPICEALGVDYIAQFKRAKSDAILGELLSEQTIVAADGKQRKMACMPERYIYGWIFGIDSRNASLTLFKRQCYDLLFQHFHGTITGRVEAIRERALAMREMEQIRKDLEKDVRWKRLQELQGVVLHRAKELKEADRAVEREQLSLFAETSLN